jgi:hypothetical protein
VAANLALNPPLTHAFDQSTIPYYNVYFSDTWHMKPSFTLTYGMGWTLEMPPTEANRQADGTGGRFRRADQVRGLPQPAQGWRRNREVSTTRRLVSRWSTTWATGCKVSL